MQAMEMKHTSPKKSLREEAMLLAEKHKQVDPQTTHVILYSTEDDDIIKLLEVSRDVPSSGSVFAISFAPGNGIHYISSVILLSPRDFKKLKDGKLALPEDWGSLNTGNVLIGKPGILQ